jgi:Replication Fork Protection Component Swi3
LNYYQLWLDDLYPRAKFADGLQLVEKVGHGKNMQRMRREWIDEGKPGYLRDREAKRARDREDEVKNRADERLQANATAGSEKPEQAKNRDKDNESGARKLIFGTDFENEDMFFRDSNTTKTQEDEAPEDDELEALLAEQMLGASSKPAPAEPDSEGEDDLDALLAEQESRRHPGVSSIATTKGRDIFEENDDNDDDDLDALLAEQEVRLESKRVVPVISDRPENDREAEGRTTGSHDTEREQESAIFSSSPIPNEEIDDDEIDAIIVDQETKGPLTACKGQEQLSETMLDVPLIKDDSQGIESGPIFSSSPIPNADVDDHLLEL